jgi:hypothetical protein
VVDVGFLMEGLRKCKLIVMKEKIWNIFKNEDTKNSNKLTYDQVEKAAAKYLNVINIVYLFMKIG